MNVYAKAINRYANKYERIKIVDFLRGFCALLMVFDHIMFDLMSVAGPMWGYNKLSMELSSLATTYWFSTLRAIGWPTAVACFVFLCGFSTGLSKNNLLRGFRLAVVSMLITALTSLLEVITNSSGIAINFGILHTLSFCILAYSLCIEGGKKITLFKSRRRTYYLSDLLIIILFITTCFVVISEDIRYTGQLATYQYSTLFDMDLGEYIIYAFGITKSLPSSDYIPILPWFAIFLTGAFFAGSLRRKRKVSLSPKSNDFVSYIGRRSLLLYCVHQPIIYVVLYIIGVITTGRIIISF